jgi:drug/metabolite transporter (DMT)-like permease
MFLLGSLAALGTAFCWSMTAIFFSFSGRIVGSGVVNRSRLVFALLFLSLTHLALEGTLFPFDAEAYRWGWLALSSILGLVLGDTFLFRAYVLIGPRLSSLMMASVPIISALLAWIFLGEQLSSTEILGIIIAVSGIAWVVTEKQAGLSVVENKNYSIGLLFGLFAAMGQATNLIAAKFALDGNFPSISATSIRILVALVILWAVAGLQGQIIYTVKQWRNQRAFPSIIGGTITGPFIGIWLSLVAIQLTRVGIAATLMALPPVILLPLGYFFYRERVSRRGIIGTLIAFVGVAVIFLIGA